MTLALDANVLIAIVRGHQPLIRKRFDEARGAGFPLVTSLIVFHELLYGCERHRRPAEERRRVDAVLTAVSVEALDEGDMAAAAKVRAGLRLAGRPIGPYDVLIAGQALARGWTVVTANTGEFGRVEGLKIIDWTLVSD